MKFWDSSALVPLLVNELRTDTLRAYLADVAAVAVWWLTPVECWSALTRLEREGRLTEHEFVAAGRVLTEGTRRWAEVPPVDAVREQAARLLRVHALRAADALQLAAAVVLADFEPRTLPFVTLDALLASAARREGFEVLGTA